MFQPLYHILFWQYPDARVFIFSYWVIGIVGLIEILLNIYKWVKGNIFEFRFSYLKKVKTSKDLESVWPSIWMVPCKEMRMNEKDEEVFFNIFSNKIEGLLKRKKNLLTIWKLLDNFHSSIDNRSITLLVIKDACSKILQWHFEIWKMREEV